MAGNGREKVKDSKQMEDGREKVKGERWMADGRWKREGNSRGTPAACVGIQIRSEMR